MTYMDTARMLKLPAMTLAALEATPLPANHQQLHDLFWQDPQGFIDAAPREDRGLSILRMYLDWIPEMKARYDALGIPEQIFLDNLKDIGIWCRDYIAHTGLPGLRTWHWIAHSLRLELIRLGRLQFEPCALEEDIHFAGRLWPAGTPVLAVHIPAEDPLDPQAALASFAQAEDFFPRYFGKSYPLFHCHSWLLSPMLRELLPANSRILQFQGMFEVLDSAEDPQAEERVFGEVLPNPADYPENTSLQRALKAYLLDGHKSTAAAAARLWRQT